MKFRFRLEKVMSHRRVEVDLAQRIFFEAQANENRVEAIIKRMERDKMDALELRFRLLSKGGAVAEELNSTQFYLEGQKVRIERERKVLEGLKRITEEKRLILVEAMRTFKTLEKLRERKFEEFKKERNKKEAKTIDDIVVMNYARRGQV